MRTNSAWGLILLLGSLSVPAAAATLTLAPDRMAEVDGHRTFILGMYENPKEDAELDRLAEAGFNLVRVSGDEAALDRLHARGLWGWVNTGAAIDLSKDRTARERQLEALVKDCAGHPAMLVWEVPDEALWNCWYQPHCWRSGEEPAQQRALIDSLEDRDLAKALRAELARIGRLYGEARYAEGEEAADAVWMKLGETPPKPGYGVSTSAARAAAMCGGMVEGYRLLRRLDPAHPVWMNHAPRNTVAQLAAFNAAADVVGCDIYPIPFSTRVGHSDLAERSAAAVGAYTLRMQEAAPGKAVWMVLQGFGWGDIQPQRPEEVRRELRRPSLAETRFMAYDAIARGARGMLYWGTHAIEKDSKLWENLLELGRELSGLQAVLSAPEADLDVRVTFEEGMGSVDRGLVVLPKAVGDQTGLLVVNEWTGPLHYRIEGLKSLEGVRYVERESGKEATVDRGALRLYIAGQSVHLLMPR